VPSPSISGPQRTPKGEHHGRKRTVSQSSTSLSSGAGSGKEGSHAPKGASTSKHRKGEDKGRGARDGKVGVLGGGGGKISSECRSCLSATSDDTYCSTTITTRRCSTL